MIFNDSKFCIIFNDYKYCICMQSLKSPETSSVADVSSSRALSAWRWAMISLLLKLSGQAGPRAMHSLFLPLHRLWSSQGNPARHLLALLQRLLALLPSLQRFLGLLPRLQSATKVAECVAKVAGSVTKVTKVAGSVTKVACAGCKACRPMPSLFLPTQSLEAPRSFCVSWCAREQALG